MNSKEIINLIPNLKWSQDKDYIYLNIEADNAIDFNFQIKDNIVSFNFISNNNNYAMKFELYNNVDHIKYIDYKSYIKLTLEKKSKEYWNYLTYDKNIYKNHIKLDWSKWIDEDDEEESEFNFNNVMKNMGGMMNNEETPFDFSKMMDTMNNNLDNEEEGEEDENYCENCENLNTEN